MRLLKGAGTYGLGGLVLNFKLICFKNAVIEANKGHLHCYIEKSIMMYDCSFFGYEQVVEMMIKSVARGIW